MAVMNGSALFLYVNVGTSETPDWEAVPCQTSLEYSLSVDAIDTSCKDSGDATNIPGRRERSISAESRLDDWPEIVSSPTTALQGLRKAAETGLQIPVAIYKAAAEEEAGLATITGLTVSAPDQDATTLSIELAISGALA
jgi:predicted secreted protein